MNTPAAPESRTDRRLREVFAAGHPLLYVLAPDEGRVDRLLARGILSKDTHGTVIRIAPPLNVPREALVWAIGEIRGALADVENERKRAA